MNNIKKLRVAAGLKQSELGTKLSVGQTTVSNWETGYSQPDFESLLKMADIFDCSIDEILGRDKKTPVGIISDEQFMVDCSTLSEANRQKVLSYASWLLEQQADEQEP